MMNLNKVLTKGAIAFVMCAAAASACGYVTNTWKGVSGRWRDDAQGDFRGQKAGFLSCRVR